MIKRLKIGILALALSLGAFLPMLVAAPALAQVSEETKQAACEGIGDAGGDGCDSGADTDISALLAQVINILSWIVGVVAIFMIIIGGMKYILSGGDAAGVSSAKNTIIYSLVGLVVAALAQVLVQFVIGRV